MATFEQFRKSFPDQSYAKGKKFEDFLSDFLQNKHPFYSKLFVKVWPFRQFPKRWHNKPDLGTDLVAEDREGRICAIQVKFFGKEYAIPKGEVDSFLTDSNVKIVDYRLLIASTDKIGLNAIVAIETQEKPVQTFLLSDLEKWTGWPRSINSEVPKTKPNPKIPRDYQRAAIKAVVEGLDTRGQLIMACGTGKTLTSQRIAEALESKETLVLVPSLLLLAQTLDDWVVNGEVDFDFLAVCSDLTVTRRAEDKIEFQTNDCGFLVAKTKDEIVSFISKRSKKPKVIFSTYASCPKVAEAIRQKGSTPFDLLIADEAHQCAGKVSDEYLTALSDERLPASKRLFMTATPRVFSAGIKNSANERGVDVVSMDDETVFGPVLHQLTFGQAISHTPPILTDYQVAIVGVTSEEVADAINKRDLMITDSGLKDDASQLAGMVGLSLAMKKYDLRRLISFHSRVSRAQEFSERFRDLVEELKPHKRPKGEIKSAFVSSKMNAHTRNERLRELANISDKETYLLCNARCLAEGVDVKAVDTVVFSDPKNSKVEIIQAIGRAIRLSKNKRIGTIVIPVFVRDREDPEIILDSSQFQMIWTIIGALRSHDEVLGDELDEMRRQLARKNPIKFEGRKIIFDLPKTLGEKFINSLEVKLVESTTEKWKWWYEILRQHVEKNNTAKVPQHYVTSDGVRLGKWVGMQRRWKKMNILSKERIQLLDKLKPAGWVWDVVEDNWNKGFQLLCEYVSKTGTAYVTRKWSSKINRFKELNQWARWQRLQYKDNNLRKEYLIKIRPYEKIGWCWDLEKGSWENSYGELKKYAFKKGNIEIPIDFKTTHNVRLINWVQDQKKAYAKKALSKDRIKLLENLSKYGWCWNELEANWASKLKSLKAYLQKNHYKEITKGTTISDGFKLGKWIQELKQRVRANNLSNRQLQDLNRILPKNWHDRQKPASKEHKWEDLKKLLTAYFAEFGNLGVSQTYVCPDGTKLGLWCARARSKYSLNKLPMEQIQFLNKYRKKGWFWTGEQQNEKILVDYIKLIENFYGVYGHSFVTKGSGLSNAAHFLRVKYKKKQLSKDQINFLENKLEFKWDKARYLWICRYKAFRRWAFKNKTCTPKKGDYVLINLSKNYKTKIDLQNFRIKALASFRFWQRPDLDTGFKQKPAKLTDKQIRLLNKIPNWNWDAKQDRWNSMFQKLSEFIKLQSEETSNEKIYNNPGIVRWWKKQLIKSQNGELHPLKQKKINTIPTIHLTTIAGEARSERVIDNDEFQKRFNLLTDFLITRDKPSINRELKYKGFALGAQVHRWRRSFSGNLHKRPLTESQVEQFEQLGINWVWNTRDISNYPFPYEHEILKKVLQSLTTENHRLLLNAILFAGFTPSDFTQFDVVNRFAFPCFLLSQTPSAKERLIPIHPSLSALKPDRHSYNRILRQINKLFGIIKYEKPSGIMRMRLNFREKLRKSELHFKYVNSLLGWGPSYIWNADSLSQAREKIMTIKYP